MAKAKATFSLADVIDTEKRQKKSNKIFYMVLMIGLAQILKSCAENDYADKFISSVEDKLDAKLFKISQSNLTDSTEQNRKGHHHGPKVQANKYQDEKVSLDQIIDERNEEIDQILDEDSINDLTMHQKLSKNHKFSPEMLKNKIKQKSRHR